MATLEQNYNAATISSFKIQVRMGAIKTAIAIQGEDESGIAIPAGAPAQIDEQEMHNRRAAFAYKVLHKPRSKCLPMALRPILICTPMQAGP